MITHGPVVAYMRGREPEPLSGIWFYALAVVQGGGRRGTIVWRCVDTVFSPRRASDRTTKGLVELYSIRRVQDADLLALQRRGLLRNQPDDVQEALVARLMVMEDA